MKELKEDLKMIDIIEERVSLNEAIELFNAVKNCESFRIQYIFAQVLCDLVKANDLESE